MQLKMVTVQYLSSIILCLCTISSVHHFCYGLPSGQRITSVQKRLIPPFPFPFPLQPPTLSSEQSPSPLDEEDAESGFAETELPSSTSVVHPIAFHINLRVDGERFKLDRLPATLPFPFIRLATFGTDKRGSFSHNALNLEQGVFQAPCDGIYFFTFAAHFKVLSDTKPDDKVAVAFCMNDQCNTGDIKDTSMYHMSPVSKGTYTLQTSGIIQLQASDMVKPYIMKTFSLVLVLNTDTTVSCVEIHSSC